MDMFSFNYDLSQQDTLSFFNQQISNTENRQKIVNSKKSPERKPITNMKRNYIYPPQDSQDFLNNNVEESNYNNYYEGAGMLSMSAVSQKQNSEMGFAFLQNENDMFAKNNGNTENNYSNSVSYPQAAMRQQQNANSNLNSNSFTNKKKPNNDFEKTVSELENFFTDKKQLPTQNFQNQQIHQYPQHIPEYKTASHPSGNPINAPQNVLNQGTGNNFYNKRSRTDICIPEENEEEEGQFFENRGQYYQQQYQKQYQQQYQQQYNIQNPNHSNQKFQDRDRQYSKPSLSKTNMQKSESANMYSKRMPLPVQSVKDSKDPKKAGNKPNPQQIQPNYQNPRREKDQKLQNIQTIQPIQQIQPMVQQTTTASEMLIKKSKRTKKVVLEETNEPVDKEIQKQEMISNYFALERIMLEKKEKVKRIMAISKSYEKYFQRVEDFNNRLPTLFRRYLKSYQDFLFKANQLLTYENSGVDEIIENNKSSIEEVQEKFKFFYFQKN